MSKASLLWMDLEMTGLEPGVDRILEVAVIATDWDFKAVASFEAGIKIDEAIITERMLGVAGDFWNANPQARDGVLKISRSGNDAKIVEAELIDFIKNNFEDDTKVLLAGNSIHQDRKFIEAEWPELNKLLHYRMLDVSAWKVVFDGKYNKRFAKPEAHRALDDIKGSIEELKYYLKRVKNGS